MEQPEFTMATLECGACLWEAVLDLLNGDPEPGSKDEQVVDAVEAARERLGTSQLRLTVLAWVPAAEADWATVKVDLWDKPFDWEWCPDWILANVDWSDHIPTLKSPRSVPGGPA